MNFESFNIFGYVSVLLWLVVPVLWFLHSRMNPRRWIIHVALLVSVVAWVLASLNSSRHVNQIQMDRSAQLAALKEERDSKRDALLASRSDEVADVRFAEDGADDYYDRAGMDETELKYMDSINESKTPGWKNKKKRSGSSGDEDDIENMIGAVEEQESVDADPLQGMVEEEPIVMNAEDLKMAHLMDKANLSLVRLILLIAIFYLVVDYLRRGNQYQEAYMPLPLPSSWLNHFTPLPSLRERPESSKRKSVDELKWLVRRGDVFLYVTDDDHAAAAVPDKMKRLFGKAINMDVLRVDSSNRELKADFVFESLWFGRSSFVVSSKARAEYMISSFCRRLQERKSTRSKVKQVAHIVWDADQPLSPPLFDEFTHLAEKTGMSLFLLSPMVALEEPEPQE